MNIAKHESKENINDSYFDGYYKDVWRAIIPPELTTKEVEFMFSYFGLKVGDKVLDLMCGYGRHAIALAKKGIGVTAVDNLASYVEEIEKAKNNENLLITPIRSDILKYNSAERFDLALCMGNSLNFFKPLDVKHLLRNIRECLKGNAFLLINSWSLAEIAIKSFSPRAWDETNGIKHISEGRYLFHPTRIESTSTFLSGDRVIETKQAVDYIYSVAEIDSMLRDTGFNLTEIYSIPGKKKFALGDPRAYIVAQSC